VTAQSRKAQSAKSKLTKARLLITPESLIRHSDPSSLQFSTTDELPALHNVIGQPRALRALELGMDVTGIGYNIFVLGIPDSGRTTLTRNYLLQKAQSGETPDDWCYVNNFENPHQPNALSLPAGKGVIFRDDMKGLIALCAQNISRAFESEEYSNEHERLRFKLKKKWKKELHQFVVSCRQI
jgi:Cdc6-like AAA superfamily ATPase